MVDTAGSISGRVAVLARSVGRRPTTCVPSVNRSPIFEPIKEWWGVHDPADGDLNVFDRSRIEVVGNGSVTGQEIWPRFRSPGVREAFSHQAPTGPTSPGRWGFDLVTRCSRTARIAGLGVQGSHVRRGGAAIVIISRVRASRPDRVLRELGESIQGRRRVQNRPDFRSSVRSALLTTRGAGASSRRRGSHLANGEG